MKKILALALACIMILSVCSFAAAEEPVTLKILFRSSDVSGYTDTINLINEKLLAAGINAKLEPYAEPSSNYPDFVNNMLQTWDESEIYDIIYVQGTAINPSYLGSLDLLVDMTDLLANSTNAKAIYDADSILQAQFASCPYLLWPSQVNKCLQFRTDALKACPSFEDFLANPDQAAYTKLFDELKAQGYEGVLTTQGIDYLFDTGVDSGFGITATWLKNEDGTYTYSRVSENFLNELKWWRDMYVSGNLHANFATDNWESMENALYTGKVAGIAMKGGAYTVYYDTNTVTNYGEEATLTILPPMKSAEGAQQYKITSGRFDRGYVISTTCKNPELAFAVLDFMLGEEGRKMDLFGFEGIDHTLNADGTYDLKVNSSETSFQRIFDSDVFGSIDVQAVTTGVKYWPDPSFESAKMMTQYGVADNDFVIPDDLATAWTACETLWKEFATQYILGEKTDADWQAYVDTWNSYGGDKVAEYAATVIK
ncbi:MAG: extracellular solute-binding protein [Clostridia bacterium]|nr:extracellular solute-binding protein [Clostridia bacterium]